MRFNARDYSPWQGWGDETAEEYASRMWGEPDSHNETSDFDLACKLAEFDQGMYDSLWEYAKGRTDWPDEVKIKLFDALVVRKRPPKGKAETAYRNIKLKAIAAVLVEKFRLNLTSGNGNRCAASILTDLLPMISEEQIANILTARRSGKKGAEKSE